jgi:hypothetical protein
MPKEEEQLSLGLTYGLEPPQRYLSLETRCPNDGTPMWLDFENESVAGDVACPKCGKVLRISEKDLALVRRLFLEHGLF